MDSQETKNRIQEVLRSVVTTINNFNDEIGQLEKENERLKGEVMTDKEKLKEIEEICKVWKVLRVLGMESEKIEVSKLYDFIEKEADTILNIIKEK